MQPARYGKSKSRSIVKVGDIQFLYTLHQYRHLLAHADAMPTVRVSLFIAKLLLIS
jgi:hypothetical protein